MADEKLIGKVIHFYNNIDVGIIELSDVLKVGDKIHVKGHGADFEQVVDSMQVEHQDIDTAKSGDQIGLKVAGKVKEGAEVFKIIE